MPCISEADRHIIKMKLLLKISYDGSGYSGYQTQPDRPSVQKTLTDAVSQTFGFPCTVTGCSRTDAGVHALGFCCAVEPLDGHESWLTIPVGKVHRVLSRHLPEDIAVVGEAVAGEDFHPRYSVKEKTYIYKMYDSAAADPFLRGRAWHLKRALPENGVDRMNEAARYLVGKHDFTSFMASGSKITDAVRTINDLKVTRSGGEIKLTVTADGFLYNMVRIITGTLIDCAAGTFEPHDIAEILAAKDRTKAGKTAPPDGLYLAEVRYDRDIAWTID